MANPVKQEHTGERVAELTGYYSNGNEEYHFKSIPSLPMQMIRYEYNEVGEMTNRNHSTWDGSQWVLQSRKNMLREYQNRIVGYKEGPPSSIKKFVGYQHKRMGVMHKKAFFTKGSTTAIDGMNYPKTIFGAIKEIFNESTTFTQTFGAGAPIVDTFKYSYDDENLITSVDKNGNTTYAEYDYDEMGRFTKKSEDGLNLEYYQYYPGTNQLSHVTNANSPENFVYDPDGNMVLDRERLMTIDYNSSGEAVNFNFYNQLPTGSLTWYQVMDNKLEDGTTTIRRAQVEMLYGVGGNRVMKTAKDFTTSTHTSYIVGYVGGLAVYTGTDPSNMSLEYINYVTPGGMAGKRNVNTNAEFFYLKDHQGSARLVLDKNGDMQASNVFAPYGELDEKLPGVKRARELYTGKELDTNATDLGNNIAGMEHYYFGARYFHPKYGIWLTTDPAGQFYNPYGFGGDPVIYVDPNGEWVNIVVGAVIGAAVGGYTAYKTDTDFDQALGLIIGGAAVGAASAGIGSSVAGGGGVAASEGLTSYTVSNSVASGTVGGAFGGYSNYLLNSVANPTASEASVAGAAKAVGIGGVSGAGGSFAGQVSGHYSTNTIGSTLGGGVSGGISSGLYGGSFWSGFKSGAGWGFASSVVQSNLAEI